MSILPTGIRLHKSGKFLVDKTVNGKRVTKTFATLEEAILFRRALERGEIKIEDSTSKPVFWTLKQAYEQAHRTVWQGKSSAVTNEFNGRAALDFFGEDFFAKDITPQRLDDYVSHLIGKGNKPATINRKLSALSVMLKVSASRGGSGAVKPPSLPRLKEAEHRIRFVSPEEEEGMQVVLTALGYTAHLEAVQVLLYTGFRCGELWSLEKRDVNFETRMITLWKTKSGKPRAVPIVPNIEPILKQRLIGKGDADKVFPEGSNPWLRNAWEKMKTVMGLDHDDQFSPHCLRHTCATRLSQQGIAIPVIKEWLGHSNVQTTMRYAHFNRKDLFAAAEALIKQS